ncbi:PilN domain-containing protein [Frateuria aurantia]|uniref:Tfp pilus assembly protein PilN n=1 Tax=Frateuria aurantia (strain ATCC 33424 / DSM 6220 / KCTC 2777 / LMG 1558 / NBRC 3245 / NCIMB 13370) TaxID=767434 RepID=H8L079_FRAAD|nr:PilN domain-containing protein [Frateuria aurantia]AFC87117.1 Tfp pilus assembly protein PilN [Frateuria aurantia DSM 6220]
MVKINLLPWREERKQLQVRRFYAQLGLAALAGVILVVLWSTLVGLQQQHQETRNAYLQAQLTVVNHRIGEIHDLQKVRSQLLDRKQIIEQLQLNRSQMVHLFDALVRTIPDSVRLTSLKQTGDTMLLDGMAQSNASVAGYMRAIEASPWMGQATLMRTENRHENAQMPYQFSLVVKLRNPELANDAPAAAASIGKGRKP